MSRAKKRVYYAHPVSIYDTEQERRDLETLEALGLEVVNPNTPERGNAYRAWKDRCVDGGMNSPPTRPRRRRSSRRRRRGSSTRFADTVAKHATAFVLDVAEKAEGGWTLVEVNDLQCAGLSDCSADVFYRELLRALREEKIAE